MTFFIVRGFAELQILKKWKWPYLLNGMEYCDEILHIHWYCHDLAHEIVKWHLGLVEVLPRFKFWKQWNLTLKPFGIFWLNFADTLIVTRSSSRNCKMTFIIRWGFAEGQILKKWKWPFLLNWVEYRYWQDVPHEIVKWRLRLDEFLPRFEFWKKWDYCKMTFIIGRGFAERQILKKWKWPYLLNWDGIFW